MSGRREYRRFLPHVQEDNRTYFVTFCTTKRWILPPQARDIALKQTVASAGDDFYLHVGVIMPDHVHVLITPLWNRAGETLGLGEIVGRIKGRSARFVNLALDRGGRVWQREYFDRELREDELIRRKGEYICANPVRAGLVKKPDDYPWIWRSWIEGTKSTG